MYLANGESVRHHLYVGLALAGRQVVRRPRLRQQGLVHYHMFALQEHFSLNEDAAYRRGAQSSNPERHLNKIPMRSTVHRWRHSGLPTVRQPSVQLVYL